MDNSTFYQLEDFIADRYKVCIRRQPIVHSLHYLFSYLEFKPDSKLAKILAAHGVKKESLNAFENAGIVRNAEKLDEYKDIRNTSQMFSVRTKISQTIFNAKNAFANKQGNAILDFNDFYIAKLIATNGTVANNAVRTVIGKEAFDRMCVAINRDILGNTSKRLKLDLSRTPELVSLGEETHKKSPILIGREREIEELTNALMSYEISNALIIGEAGVGKTALVEHLAFRMFNNDIDFYLQNKDIVRWDLGQLMTSTRYVGELETKMQRDLAVVTKRDDLFVFMDEIHTMIGAGRSEGSNVGLHDYMKPHLTSGRLKLIGATTKEEYDQFVRPTRAFARRFQTIELAEPTRAQTIEILEGIKHRREKFYGLTIPTEIILKIAERCGNQKGQSSPAKELKMLDMTCVKAKRTYEKSAGIPSSVETVCVSEADMPDVKSSERVMGFGN